MRTGLKFFLMLFGTVCILIALTHIVFGPSSIPGSVPVNATLDNEDRFYATLFFGFGLALIWTARAIEERIHIIGFLLFILFLGGLARLVSILSVGLPHPLFIGLMVVELMLPPLVWIALRRSFSAPRS